jgi:hypothetical protein
MSAEATPKKPASQSTRGQKAFLILVVGSGVLLWMIAINSPIPSGKENREKARPF